MKIVRKLMPSAMHEAISSAALIWLSLRGFLPRARARVVVASDDVSIVADVRLLGLDRCISTPLWIGFSYL